MSDYNNYNGYEQPNVANVAPGAPIVLNQQPEKSSKALGIWSIVLAVCGFCCCGFTSIIGLVLGLVGLKNKNGRGLCIVGVILSAISTILYIISLVTTFNNPEFMEQYMQMVQQIVQASESTGSMQ